MVCKMNIGNVKLKIQVGLNNQLISHTYRPPIHIHRHTESCRIMRIYAFNPEGFFAFLSVGHQCSADKMRNSFSF